MPDNLTTHCLTLFLNTPLRRVAIMLLSWQLWMWKKRARLTIKISDFLPIGGVSNIIQLPLLFGCLSLGMGVFSATFVSVQLAALINFIGNRFITWKEEFTEFTQVENFTMFVPLFIIFDLTTPTVWMKILGVDTLADNWGLTASEGFNVTFSWTVLTIIGIILNFVFADRFTFGVITRTLSALNRRKLHHS